MTMGQRHMAGDRGWSSDRRGQEESKPLLERLQEMLGALPGIGPKSAERIAHHLLAASREEVFELADALRAVKEKLKRCSRCCVPTEAETCFTCLDTRRDSGLLCVVEQPRDQAAFERMGTYRGLYHILHGRLSPLEGVGPEKLTIDQLITRVRSGEIREVILATNPTLEGDGTSLYIAGLLGHMNVRITRLARGIPAGSVLEFANSQMLADAMDGRNTF